MKGMELSGATMDRMREHAKQHKGGMGSKHMRLMKKLMTEGMSFTKAHNRAMKEHPPPKEEVKKKNPKNDKNEDKGLKGKQSKLPEGLKKAIMKKQKKSMY